MGTKKDIGKIFQEKFKDFEQAPDNATWDHIASELGGSKGSRYPLLLWMTTGVVVLGLIGLLFWQPWTSDEQSAQPSITHTAKGQEIKDGALENTPTADTSGKTNSQITVAGEIGVTSSSVATQKTAISNPTKNTTASSDTSTSERPDETSPEVALEHQGIKTTAASEKRSSRQNRSGTAQGTRTAFADKQIGRNTSEAGIIRIDESTKSQLAEREQQALMAYKTKLASERKEMLKQIEKQRLAAVAKRDSLSKQKAMALAQAKAESEADKASRATTKDKKSEAKTAQERAEDRKEAVTYNFSVSPYTSILSYGSLVKGSSIDDRLVDNPREAITTQGYGIRLEYVLNERSSFRFGVGVAPLKYRTNNFQVLNNGGTINVYQFSGLTPTQLEQGGTPTDPQAVDFFNNYDVITIEQNISYIELPMDYQYKLINRRVGLSLNPGLSVFILTDNNVFAIADDSTRLRIGRETRLNDLSFAFNLGLGGFYNFAKNWRLDVEPTFRYQLNPYSNNLGNFRPYYIGVQFGATYKF